MTMAFFFAGTLEHSAFHRTCGNAASHLGRAHDSPLGGGHQGADKKRRQPSHHGSTLAAARLNWVNKSMGSGSRRVPPCETFQSNFPTAYCSAACRFRRHGPPRVNVDFITKLPATVKDGYDCIITIVDPLTKRVRWKAAKEKDLTAKAFAKDFIDVCGYRNERNPGRHHLT